MADRFVVPCAIVTGASRELGRPIAGRLARKRVQVALLAQPDLSLAEAEIGPGATTTSCDLRYPDGALIALGDLPTRSAGSTPATNAGLIRDICGEVLPWIPRPVHGSYAGTADERAAYRRNAWAVNVILRRPRHVMLTAAASAPAKRIYPFYHGVWAVRHANSCRHRFAR